MYNDQVTANTYEIRVCGTCGLRYPLLAGHPFGTRCPVCMGDTRAVLRRRLSTEASAAPDLRREQRKSLAVLLDNVRSAWNVGSILRSADGFGFRHAYLCGITPPADHESVAKTSLGAEQSVAWTYHKDALEQVRKLKEAGCRMYALEEDPRAMEVQQIGRGLSPSSSSVLIVGNEVTGVDPELLDLCDRIFYIPMNGEKKSFNVAIAFSVAAFAISAAEANGST